MSRELKFRGWDIKNQQFVNTYDYACQFDGSTIYNHDHYEWTSYLNSTIQIQQYTGLLDKNGVEIYEGDILAADHDGGEGEANIGVVFYAAGTFMIDGDGPFYDHVYGHSPDILDNHTVIGNKFENPELLKA